MRLLPVLVLVALAAPPNPVAAQTVEDAVAIISRTARAPVIDGTLGTDEWSEAVPFALVNQIQPGDNVPASEATRLWLVYDADNIYVAIDALDTDPAAIRARVGRRDDIAGDDYVVLHLDTFNDRRRAYVFWFNPFGIQADGLYNEGQIVGRNFDSNIDRTWDGVLTSKGRVHDRGYSIEASIPLKTLRFQAGANQTWGLHAQRWIAHKAEQVSWRPISRDVSSLLVQMGSLRGLQELRAERAIEVIPSAVASSAAVRSAGRLDGREQFDPGITGSWAVTPNAIITGTANPDFSQVEADVPQIEVNQRFPLNYAEKRPFFLEGAPLFRSPGALNFLNTRNIVDPDWGAKFTGKIGRNALAAVVAADRAPGLRADPAKTAYENPSYFALARYQRDLGQNSTVGGFLSMNQFSDSSNLVASADGNFRFKSSQVIGFQASRGATTTLDGEHLNGSATYLWYEFQGRHWRLFLNDQRMDPGYRNAIAFVRRTGFHANSYNVGYEFQPAVKTWWVRIRPFVTGRHLKTSEGLVDESYNDPGADITLARDIRLYLYHSFRRDAFAGREFPHQFSVADTTFNTFKRLTLSWRIQAGEGVNFDPGRVVVGGSLIMNLTLTFKPFEALNQEVLFLTSRLRDQDTRDRLFKQDIYRSRTNYQFTQAHAARVILEYTTQTARLSTSYLYSFTPQANTAIYAGYGDIRSDALEPYGGTRADRWAPLQRTTFVKISYGFRP